MSASMSQSVCIRSRVPSPCSRGAHGAVARNVATHSSVVPAFNGGTYNIDDLVSPDKKWQKGIEMQKQLREAVKVEDFATAARCRDAIAQLSLSPIQSLEMTIAENLMDETCSYDEKAKSLKKLSLLNPTEETQRLILDAIQDEALTTVAQKVIQAIWLRHPHNSRVSELLEEGLREVEMATGCIDMRNSPLQLALAKFEEAASLDPTFPDTWNHIGKVHYLTYRYSESLHACEQALRLNPYHYLAQCGKAMCLAKLNQREEALQSMRKALRINPFLTQFRRALCALEKGES